LHNVSAEAICGYSFV